MKRTTVFRILLLALLAIPGILKAQDTSTEPSKNILVFTVVIGEYSVQIDAMASDGSVTQLTEGNNLSSDPSWSPDGKQMAFTIYQVSNGESQQDIYIMDADGSHLRNLTQSKAGFPSLPRWSPDGTQIVFMSTMSGSSTERDHQIYTINIDGSDLRNLTENKGDNGTPAWSPDGKQIAFASDHEGGDYAIYTMNADGSDMQRLTPELNGGTSPKWSPDGKHILFVFNSYLKEMTVDGTPVNLPIISVGSALAWTPDSQYFTYFNGSSFVVVDADGSNQRSFSPQLSGGNAVISLDWNPTATSEEIEQLLTALPTTVIPTTEPEIENTAVPVVEPTDDPNDGAILVTPSADGSPLIIAYGETFQGSIEPNGEVLWGFEGVAGQIVRLEVDFPNGDFKVDAPQNYQMQADSDGDFYNGAYLPLTGFYTIHLNELAGKGGDYTLKLILDADSDTGENTGSEPLVLHPGGKAQVDVEDDGLKLRTGPDTSEQLIETVPSGTIVTLIEGPFPSGGYFWWHVRTPNGNEGWMVEGADGIITLIPVAG